MSMPQLLIIGALLLALIDEFESRGRSILGWAVVLICISALWGRL